jgi:ferredoxin
MIMIGLYFSGTGNSKHCIEKFLNHCGEGIKSYSIEDINSASALENSQDIVLAYPVYFSNMPKILSDYIQQHGELFRGKNIFLIATMGFFSGDGTGCGARKLQKQGAIIKGGLHLKMPDCIGDVKLLKKSMEKNQLIIKAAEEKCKKAAVNYMSGSPSREGLGILSHIAGLFGQRLWFYAKTREYSNKLKIDRPKCSGCGTCVSVCPMVNIVMLGEKAICGNSCTMCYRCIGQCPQRAITLLGNKVVEQCRIENYK